MSASGQTDTDEADLEGSDRLRDGHHPGEALHRHFAEGHPLSGPRLSSNPQHAWRAGRVSLEVLAAVRDCVTADARIAIGS